jgi:pantothenate synthetase
MWLFNIVEVYQRFGVTYSFRHYGRSQAKQAELDLLFDPEVEAMYSSETSADTRCNQ